MRGCRCVFLKRGVQWLTIVPAASSLSHQFLPLEPHGLHLQSSQQAILFQTCLPFYAADFSKFPNPTSESTGPPLPASSPLLKLIPLLPVLDSMEGQVIDASFLLQNPADLSLRLF